MAVRFLTFTFLFLLIFPALSSKALAVPADCGDTGNPCTFKITQPKGFGIDPTPGGSAEGIVGIVLKNVVALFFVVGGIGALIFFLWGAVEWIFSGGDKEKVAAARKRLTNSLIGLALLSLAFVIISVFGRIVGFNPLGTLQIPGLGETNAIPQN